MTTIKNVDCPLNRAVRKVAPYIDGGTYVPGSDHVRYRQRRSRIAQRARTARLLVCDARRRTDQRSAHLASRRPGPVATHRYRPAHPLTQLNLRLASAIDRLARHKQRADQRPDYKTVQTERSEE